MSFIESGFIYLFVTKGPTILTNLWKATLLLNFLLLCEKAHTTRNRRAASLARLSISKLSTIYIICMSELSNNMFSCWLCLFSSSAAAQHGQPDGAAAARQGREGGGGGRGARRQEDHRLLLLRPLVPALQTLHPRPGGVLLGTFKTQNKHQTMDVYDVNEFEFDNRISCKM